MSNIIVCFWEVFKEAQFQKTKYRHLHETSHIFGALFGFSWLNVLFYDKNIVYVRTHNTHPTHVLPSRKRAPRRSLMLTVVIKYMNRELLFDCQKKIPNENCS